MPYSNFEPPIPHSDRLYSSRLNREARMLRAMIEGWCLKNHDTDTLCADCRKLLRYALSRLACCPYGQNKPTCARCPVHCYREAEREKIKEIMRTMGPAMVLAHPILSFDHLLLSLKKAPPHPREFRKKME